MALRLSGDGNITGINSLNTDVSSTELGYLDGIGGIGKVLQIIRATDSTYRTTTSASFVDAGISVTITPQKSDSALLIIWILYADTADSGRQLNMQITDSSNNAISGAEKMEFWVRNERHVGSQTVVGYATPATTSATTYKARFSTQTSGLEVRIQNAVNTGQMYAIEVAA